MARCKRGASDWSIFFIDLRNEFYNIFLLIDVHMYQRNKNWPDNFIKSLLSYNLIKHFQITKRIGSFIKNVNNVNKEALRNQNKQQRHSKWLRLQLILSNRVKFNELKINECCKKKGKYMRWLVIFFIAKRDSSLSGYIEWNRWIMQLGINVMRAYPAEIRGPGTRSWAKLVYMSTKIVYVCDFWKCDNLISSVVLK